MKKISYFINDSKLLDKIASFCDKEKFIADHVVDIGAFEYDAASVIYLTDDVSGLSPEGLKDIPVCYIGQEKMETPHLYRLPNDFEGIHLRSLVDAVTHSGCFEASAASIFPVELSKSYKIKNDIFGVEKIVFALTKDFIYFIDFQSLEKIRVGFSEMLTNAIEHGNLAITGEEKLDATEKGTYYELIAERLQKPECASRLVTFTYKIDDHGIIMEIVDEGSGFDVDSLPDPTDPEGLLKLHGRGILITRMYFDEVSYNDRGNKVILSKRF